MRGEGLRLSAETLVYLIRQELADEVMVQLASQLLVGTPVEDGTFRAGHVEHLIRAEASREGLLSSPDELDEFRARCYEAMWAAIAAGTEAEPFWEERFFVALQKTTWDVRRAVRRQRKRYQPLEAASVNPDDPDQIVGPDDVAAQVIGEIERETLRQATGNLPDGPRVAVWLHILRGLPVESADLSVRTVARTMGISGSMVRRHVRHAVALLRSDPSLQIGLVPPTSPQRSPSHARRAERAEKGHP